MFSNHASPIAVDFGTASVKLLQIEGGNPPRLVRASEVAVPESVRGDADQRNAWYAAEVPKAIAKGRFKGKRVAMAIPSAQTLVQHMQFARVAGADLEELIKAQLYSQVGAPPESIVVRTREVADIHRGGQAQLEVICFAIARDTVMRYIQLLRKSRLDVVGVHTETQAMVRAFDHINCRENDGETTTLYVDLGWSGTGVSIAHGRDIMFARHIQIGGRHFDQQIAATLKCDAATARGHRLALGEPLRPAPAPVAQGRGGEQAALLDTAHAAQEADHEVAMARDEATATAQDRRDSLRTASTCLAVPPGDPPYKAANVDLAELVDTITDELSMCLRYHQGLFPGRMIDRTIFVGGEARQVWLCQHIVRSLCLPAQLGDPLSRLARKQGLATPGVNLDEPQPGWAVACGLCTAPTDL